MQKIVIIGNGIAGITAARHIRKLGDSEVLVISGESDFFFSRTALMYIYMGHMKFEHTKPYEDSFWKKNRIELKNAWVNNIDTRSKTLILDSNDHVNYDKLILALGSKPRKFGWPGQDLKGVSGLYSLQDLNSIEKSTKNIQQAVIVGGGLIGIELAEMLHSRNIKVTFLVREDNFWDGVLPIEEAKLINQEILDHGIDLRLSTELKEIVSDKNENAVAVITNSGEKIEAQFVGLTVGVAPNLFLAEKAGIKCNRGVLVDEYLKTNVPEVYALGDCVELLNPSTGRKAIEQVWYTGRMMGETVARTVCGDPTIYHPGIWFNSAKFFNIEYQTYGNVNAKILPNEKHFVWQNMKKKKLLRIVFNEETNVVLGMNVFGIRMRHEVWDGWIANNTSIHEVILNLKVANFDPEFFHQYEEEISKEFAKQFSALLTQKNA